MIHKTLTQCAGILLFASALVSCIRDEAANAECDITGVDTAWISSLLEEGILRSSNYFLSNNSVTFFKEDGAACDSLAPVFTLTPGATIEPLSGTERDFTTPQTYTVTAEDGVWKKDYTVSFVLPVLNSRQGFDQVELDASQQYQEFLFSQNEMDGASVGDESVYLPHIWASGNGGFALTGMATSPEEYPTVRASGGHTDGCARLETKNTGSFGATVGMRIAAGNLFIGEFRTASAMFYPRRATRFGLQLLAGRPQTLRGYYKYTAGEAFTDEDGNVRPEMSDTCDIYAVVYEVDPDDFVALNGDDVLSSERIVLLARIDDPGEPQEWTYFDEPFVPKNGKTFDYTRLAANGYAISIVLTSSRQGAYFRGSVGSVLLVDDIEVVY